MQTRVIPSTGEPLPVVGCGTYRGFDVDVPSAGYREPQMEESLRRLGSERVDLMQVHNLIDCQTHLDTLAAWKADGRVRYVGVTHYHSGAHAALADVLERRTLDFVQLDYSLEDRAAEQRLLPLAAQRGVAVLVNLPFGGGALLAKLSRQPLPDFAAAHGASSWAELLLLFVLGHPAVTCVIPGTGNPEHMASNAAAGEGDASEVRARLSAWLERARP